MLFSKVWKNNHDSHSSYPTAMRFFSKQFSAIALVLGLFLVLSGCMKTRIVMEKQPSNQKVELPWAHGFVYGLVPPVNAPLQTEETCGSEGIAEVYFRQTFVQGIAQGLTGNIYSPQRLTATCAAGGGMSAALPPWSHFRNKANSDRQISAASSSVSGVPRPHRKETDRQ